MSKAKNIICLSLKQVFDSDCDPYKKADRESMDLTNSRLTGPLKPIVHQITNAAQNDQQLVLQSGT